MSQRPWGRVLAGLLAGTTALAGCSLAGASGDGPRVVRVWSHGGTPEETRTLAAQVAAFNEGQDDVRVRLRTVPEGDYSDEVQAAAAAGTLPDVLDLDGPLIASYVYQDHLRPLDDLLPPGTASRLLPSLRSQGTYEGHLYGAATFDSGLGLYADRRALEAAGVDVPRGPDDAWTAEETTSALRALAARDEDGRVLDLKRAYGVGEWLTYGFSPLVWSAGGTLVDPRTGRAGGAMDGPASVRALRTLGGWAPYVDPDPEDTAFVDREVALSWVGHWAYPDYAEALGDDLVVLPLPDLGRGSRTGMGSWTWTVTRGADHPEAAGRFLAHLLDDDEVLRMTAANGAVPGTRGALARSDLYRPGAPLALFGAQLRRTCAPGARTPDCVAVPRPQTPAYPVVTARFARAVDDVLRGADPRRALGRAAAAVDEDVAANDGYGR